jgi:UDPglucose 6-dehydrogenase
LATDRVNRSLPERLATRWRARVGRDATVAILGLAYKPFSNSLEESQAMMMARAFIDHGTRVRAYDPLAGDNARREFGGRVQIVDSARECLRDADVVLIGTPDPEFKTLEAQDFRQAGRPVVVVDFWRILAGPLSRADGIEYVPYGQAPTTLPSGALEELWGGTPARHGR